MQFLLGEEQEYIALCSMAFKCKTIWPKIHVSVTNLSKKPVPLLRAVCVTVVGELTNSRQDLAFARYLEEMLCSNKRYRGRREHFTALICSAYPTASKLTFLRREGRRREKGTFLSF